MNCELTFHLIPLRDDAGLDARERLLLEEHLERCEGCRQEADALALSRGALGALTVPVLTPSEVDRMVEAAMPRASSRWNGWWSHAAAVLVGASLMALGRGCQSGEEALDARSTTEIADAQASTVTAPETEAANSAENQPGKQIVERIVEVRVEVPVEVPVERVVYRDRPVMNKLQPRFDSQLRTADLLSEAALTGVRLVDRAYVSIERKLQATPRPAQSPPPLAIASAPRRPTTSKTPTRRPSTQRTHLEVRRVDGRVTLRTRGSLVDVVPVLIDTLESEDGAVVAAALDRLQSIRADLGSQSVDLRPETPTPIRRSGIRALLSSRGDEIRASELDDAALWRDWWSRQRASDSQYRRAASI